MIIYSKLENGKKVLYERVIEGEDVKLTYVDEDGTPINLADKDTYKCGAERTIIRTSDGKMVNTIIVHRKDRINEKTVNADYNPCRSFCWV